MGNETICRCCGKEVSGLLNSCDDDADSVADKVVCRRCAERLDSIERLGKGLSATFLLCLAGIICAGFWVGRIWDVAGGMVFFGVLAWFVWRFWRRWGIMKRLLLES